MTSGLTSEQADELHTILFPRWGPFPAPVSVSEVRETLPLIFEVDGCPDTFGLQAAVDALSDDDLAPLLREWQVAWDTLVGRRQADDPV